jgi:hypothetical protein
MTEKVAISEISLNVWDILLSRLPAQNITYVQRYFKRSYSYSSGKDIYQLPVMEPKYSLPHSQDLLIEIWPESGKCIQFPYNLVVFPLTSPTLNSVRTSVQGEIFKFLYIYNVRLNFPSARDIVFIFTRYLDFDPIQIFIQKIVSNSKCFFTAVHKVEFKVFK